MYGFNISLTGSKHVLQKIPCQDYSKITCLKSDGQKVLAGVVCDGGGSALYSKQGAKVAGITYLRLIRQGLLKESFSLQDETALGRLLQTAMKGALAAVNAMADGEGHPRREYETCLTGTVLTQKGVLAWSQAGDSGLVMLSRDGSFRKPTPRCSGEEAGSVFPLSCWPKWHFGISGDAVGAVLFSDGILDYAVSNDALGSLIYWPFLSPAFCRVNNKRELAALKQRWFDLLTGKIPDFPLPELVPDDLTVVALGADSEPMGQALEKVRWDEGEFRAQLRSARRRVWPDLYPEEMSEP